MTMREECKEYFEKISEYLDGELDSETCEKIECHLRECPECLHCFESLKRTAEICRSLPREKIPEDVEQRLKEKLKGFLSKDAAKSFDL